MHEPARVAAGSESSTLAVSGVAGHGTARIAAASARSVAFRTASRTSVDRWSRPTLATQPRRGTAAGATGRARYAILRRLEAGATAAPYTTASGPAGATAEAARAEPSAGAGDWITVAGGRVAPD